MNVRYLLSAAFANLASQGLIARENFSCCGSCAGYEIATEAEKLVDEGKPPLGAVFYHQQAEESWADGGCLRLNFGHISTQKHGVIGKTMEEVGQMVVAALKAQRLPVEWDGSAGSVIRVLVNAEGEYVPS